MRLRLTSGPVTEGAARDGHRLQFHLLLCLLFYFDDVTQMAWLYLALAGLLEIGWPVGLKVAQNPDTRWSGIVAAAVCMTLSGSLLWLAQRQIPIGTAYAVWTGIGAAGTFLVGVIYYGDPSSLARYAGVACILLGVIILKLAH